tara:strand:- start:4867 stop:7101 length:2235 start_codon:yes stop_codon:yes gene_type:complete
MSLGLAFVRGLVGGFQKNIDREREARGADDARIAELENFVFEAATDPKKRVPKELGNILKDAKRQVSDRKPIDIFGRAGDRLNIDMTNLQQAVAEADDDKKFITFGQYKMPVSSEYGKGKSPTAESKMVLDAIKNFVEPLGPAEIMRMKKYFQQNKKVSDNFYDTMKTAADTYSSGVVASINPKGSTELLATPIPFKGFEILKNTFIDGQQDETDDERQYKLAKEFYSKNTKKDPLKMRNAEKNAILLPFQKQIDGRLIFIPLKFNEKQSSDAKVLKSIARLNDFGDDVGRFITAYRRETQLGIPEEGDFTEVSMNNFPEYFPRINHAIQLYRRGAWKKAENMSPKEVQQTVGYLNNSSNFSQASPLAKISALAMIQSVDQADLNINKYSNISTFKFNLKNVNESKDKIFKRFTDATIGEFNVKYKANKDVVTKLDNYVTNSVTEDTSPGGFVRGLKKVFIGLSAPSGQVGQLMEFIGGKDKRYNVSGGDLKKGTTFETLKKVVEKIKNEGGIEAELTKIQENESLMIVLAANMARALDPAGRLSNQDFEVQLRRLGNSGFFGTKAGSLASLQTVVKEFLSEFKKIDVFATIASNSERGFNRPQLQLLKANKRFNSMTDKILGLIGETKDGGSLTFDETKSFVSQTLVGPNGRPITIKYDSNNNEYYFEGNNRVDEKQIVQKGTTKVLPPEENNQVPKVNNVQQQSFRIKLGDIIGGNNSKGFLLKNRKGRFKQNPDGTFSPMN